MTYAEANHLSLAITKCVMRCRKSPEPYLELSNFIGALREGGVAEHYIQAINHAALRDIAATMIAIPPGHGAPAALGSYCYILQ
jgi:hypothetical protein